MAKDKSIYTLTVFRLSDNGKWYSATRTWTWFSSLKQAKKATIKYADFFFEMGYYTLAVIEKVPPGSMSVDRKEWWYKATWKTKKNTHRVDAIEKPKIFDKCVGWSMG